MIRECWPLSNERPETRRLFFALWPDEATRERMAALLKALRGARGRAVKAEKLHVTLAFIGTNLMEIVSPHGRGLGALFDSGKTNSDYPLMFAVLIALAVLGILLYYVVVFLERTFASWAEREAT